MMYQSLFSYCNIQKCQYAVVMHTISIKAKHVYENMLTNTQYKKTKIHNKSRQYTIEIPLTPNCAHYLFPSKQTYQDFTT